MLNKIFFILGKKNFNFFYLTVLFQFFVSILELFGVTLIIPIVTILIDGSIENFFYIDFINSFLSLEIKSNFLVYFIFFLIFFFVFKFVFLLFVQNFQSNFVKKSCNDIGERIYLIYANFNYQYFIDKKSYDLIKIINIELNNFLTVLRSYLMIFSEGLLLFLLVLFLFFYDFKITLFTFIIFFTFFFIFKKNFQKKLLILGNIRTASETQIIRNLQNFFHLIKEIKVYLKENYFFHHFTKNLFRFSNIYKKQYIIQQYPRLFIELLIVSIFVIILYLYSIEQINNNEVLVLSGLFAASAFKLVPSLQRIINAYNDIKFHNYSINIFYDLFLKEEKKKQNFIKPLKNKIDFKKNIQLKTVTFYYNTFDKFIINNINLKINKGDIVGLIGKSGSGKTTLINIITGLIRPVSGSILFDDVETLTKENLEKWKNCIGYVPQKVHLYDDNIFNNISMTFNEKIKDKKKIIDSLNAAGLKNFINSLKKGIYTNIGEQGIKISGGQVQRIGIARALYRNPDFLILDEATSSLDKQSEKIVLDSVFSLAGKLTCLIITHRKENLQRCNKIFKIHNGNLTLLDFDSV
jgi:ABC-type bacteriocin/lantibiotic exporter with double-glycine peptidase domain